MTKMAIRDQGSGAARAGCDQVGHPRPRAECDQGPSVTKILSVTAAKVTSFGSMAKVRGPGLGGAPILDENESAGGDCVALRLIASSEDEGVSQFVGEAERRDLVQSQVGRQRAVGRLDSLIGETTRVSRESHIPTKSDTH